MVEKWLMKELFKDEQILVVGDCIVPTVAIFLENELIEDSVFIFGDETFRINNVLWYGFSCMADILNPENSNAPLPEIEMN